MIVCICIYNVYLLLFIVVNRKVLYFKKNYKFLGSFYLSILDFLKY